MNRQQIIALLTESFPPTSTLSFSPETLDQSGEFLYKASLYWRDGVRTEVRVNLAKIDLLKPYKWVAVFSQYGAGSGDVFFKDPDRRSRFAMYKQVMKEQGWKPENLKYFTLQNTP